MGKNYGRFIDETNAYQLDRLPEAGNFEYLYKNKSIFLKVDQFGPSLMQLDPPMGMTILQRKERETYSPWKTFFSIGKDVFHNFDVYRAKKISITYQPHKCTYDLTFNKIKVITEIFVDSKKAHAVMSVKFINLSTTKINLKLLSCCSFDPIDSSMAVWDKKEWYSKTTVKGKDEPYFITNHYSVNGDIKERRTIVFYTAEKALSSQISYELLRSATNNFNKIPDDLGCLESDEITCYEQVNATLHKIELDSEYTINSVIGVYNTNDFDPSVLKEQTKEERKNKILGEIYQEKEKMFSLKRVNTNDKDFNSFVNTYLPLELSWVSDLDRGWPTGMRGSRDCANDFMGYLSYDIEKCRGVLKTLFDCQREDGWFPRQVPCEGSNKFDMRPFSDSGCFVIEFVYEYLAFSNDFSILTDNFSYLNSESVGSGLEHLKKAIEFYFLEENIGEHGLIKLHGGDWLDCLNKVGLQGRGESMMVTCQVVLAINQISEILKNVNEEDGYFNKLNKMSKMFKNNIKKACYINNEGFYRALFSDNGDWFFSEKDIDGYKRVYIPSNAYAIIAEVDKSKDKRVIEEINKNNRTPFGYKLFTTPFGLTPINGIGKMGTGDFQPYALENGAIYNHGANLFLIRALAKIGDYKNLFKALNYALPYNSKFHPESSSCLPSYAMTNVYMLTPTFYGRSGMCFLTGSIAMVERAIYNWMFGVDFHIDNLSIKPCLPKEYKDSSVSLIYNGHNLEINYYGYGSKVLKATVNGKDIECLDFVAKIDKKALDKNCKIEVVLDK